jgi:hypothetical protein
MKTVIFTTELSRTELFDLLVHLSTHRDVKKVNGRMGSIVGLRGSEDAIAEALAEVPRLSACWEEVGPGQRPA